jgi:hypothetical protein
MFDVDELAKKPENPSPLTGEGWGAVNKLGFQ